MALPYGPKQTGDIRIANPLPRGMGSFPVVGKGLGGLPVRTTTTETLPSAIAFYTNGISILDVFDGKWNRITDVIAPTQPTSNASGSMEQMWMPPRQKKWIGMGAYGQGTNTKGSVIDISTNPWVVYENYTAIGNDGSGNSIIRNMAPSPAGFVAGFDQSSAGDEAVCNITTKAEVTGQPAQFTSATGGGTMKVYGNNLYQFRDTGIVKYNFSAGGGVLTRISDTGLITAPDYNVSIAVSSDESLVYAVKVSGTCTLYVLDPSLVQITSIDLSPYGMTTSEAIEISPNDKWLLICGVSSTGSNGCVLIMDTTTYSIQVMTVPTGSTNARFTGCAWYSDNNQYIVTGYGGARSHQGKRTSGGSIKNLNGIVSGANQFGVAIIY
jgi:hypothetical protein